MIAFTLHALRALREQLPPRAYDRSLIRLLRAENTRLRTLVASQPQARRRAA